MADTHQKDPSYNILGSSKLNTSDGKNPSTSNSAMSQGHTGQAAGQANTDAYKKECMAAHDALEDKLRESERLARWRRE